MPSRAATFFDVTAYNLRTVAVRDPRRSRRLSRSGRSAVGSAVLGLGSVSAIALMAGTATVAAAWMVSNTLAGNPALRASAPFALPRAGLPLAPQRLAEPADMFGAALAAADPAGYAREESNRLAAIAPTALPPARGESVPLPPAPPARIARRGESVPLPSPRPLHVAAIHVAPIPVKTVIFRAPSMAVASAAPPANVERTIEPARTVERKRTIEPERTVEPERTIEPQLAPPEIAAPLLRPAPPERPQIRLQVASAVPVAVPLAPATTGSVERPAAPSPPAAIGAMETPKPARPQLAYNNPETPLGSDSHTAIYDIVAHTVYLPDGERLEAHSGLGSMLDDPRYVSAKARGPTPPNVYDLTLRSGLFHGVQAIRLNPVGDSRMFGRDGILAHTYMLGPSGQSFGCVSLKNYSEFLHAFERGEVNRMVVVTHLPSPPPGVRAERDSGEHYAFAIENAH